MSIILFEFVAMISNFLKSGLSSLEAISIINVNQNNQAVKPAGGTSQPVKLQKIVEETMAVLTAILNEKVGEQIQEQQLKQLTNEVMTSKHLQNLLLQTKQKYNQLVNKSSLLYNQAKKISLSIAQFITNINLFLESEELLVPLNDIQKGVSQLNGERVEKQFGYLIKIFTNNFQEVIDKNVAMVEKNVGEEVRVLKGLNKNLENQILGLKGNKNNDQSKYLEQALRITTLNEKINKLTGEKGEIEKERKELTATLNEKMKQINELQNQLKKMKSRESELIEKVRMLELKSVRVEKNVKERSSQAEQLNKVIEKLKQRNEERIQEIQVQHKKKQRMYESVQKKLYNQKGLFQQKIQQKNEAISTLQQKLKNERNKNTELKNQLNAYKQSNMMEIDLQNIKNSNKGELKKQSEEKKEQKKEQKKDEGGEHTDSKHKMTLQQLMAKLNLLQTENKEIQASLSKEKELGVNKEVLKGLFLSYDDQSKQWQIRRNIKYQIYSLLDLKDKMPKPEQPKANKWFGIF